MASSPRLSQFWRTDWFTGVWVVMAVIVLHLTTDLTGTLERRFYDFASTSASRQPSSRTAVIAIDDQSIASLGRWPWSRDIDARLIDQLAAAKAGTIVHTGFFFQAQHDRGLSFIQKIKGVLGASADAANPPSATHEQLARLLAEAEVSLDIDGQLADSFKRAGNVILPSLLTPGQQPLERLGRAAFGVGHLRLPADRDGVLRQAPLLVNYAGTAVPSVALLAVANSLHLSAADIQRKAGESVQVGPLRIQTDGAARMLPQFYTGHDGQPAFALDSFADVLSGKIPAARYADKIVVIGVTATGLATPLAVPGAPSLSVAEAIAHMTSSMLRGHVIVQPDWGRWATLGVVLLVCAYLILLLPHLSAGAAALLTCLIVMALLGAEFGLLAGAALWLSLVFPATLLLIGHLSLTLKRFLIRGADKPSADVASASADTNRMLGLALQGQGQLDLAFEHFRRVPMGDAVMGHLERLALEFERQQQFRQAAAVYQHLAPYNKDDTEDQDQPATLNRVNSPAECVSPVMLGRYQLERALGKGAMGVVYLGKDPKLGRVVAIKTMALSEEFEGQALEDARERFFREAQTAGRLQHQNIVTIFDAGEAQDLAYIAMEFLKGKDLVGFCQKGQLLAVPTVLSIVARVAQALAYAHRQQVVHRDIKPANIMFDPDSDTVKVTDFGIARITDASRTKTGLVLGTPSFMSPEQLAGQKIDGRSDLYSLGVMLFQLLSGVLPFRGKSLAELMHKITNEEAPDIRLLRQGLPPSLANLVAVSLRKPPHARYQDGDQLASDLRALLSAGNAIDLNIEPDT